MDDLETVKSAIADKIAALPEKSLLLMDDDAPFRNRLGRALEARGFAVTQAESVAQALDVIDRTPPAFAVMDMRLEDGNGLKAVEALHRKRPDARAIMLTGYGNIATAVAAVKSGAIDYLSKPADADDVVRALLAVEDKAPPPPENPMSADRVRWEHIQRVYALCGQNVSETARRLNMHRRTLQRILAKRAPK
ncbi:MAG: ActR/PrrA/RegA family redox response regulator transcription factor [Asticcacaulis sp.]